MNKYLKETKMHNFSHQSIQKLIQEHNWKSLDDYNKVLEVYNYIQNNILFGYNLDDSLNASEILKDKIGQCNTKGTLFMALLRALNIPCRVHGFYITKKLQYGAMKGITYLLAPKKIFHSYVEVYLDNKWYCLEGFILDKHYLKAIQNKYEDKNGYFLGYGIGTNDFKNPQIDFNHNDTFIQKEGIIEDVGIYDSMDDLLLNYSQKMSFVKKFAYQNIGRKLMNKNVNRLRQKYYK